MGGCKGGRTRVGWRRVVLIVDRRHDRGWLIVEGGEKREAKTGRSGTGPIRAGTLRVSLPGNETHPNTRGEKTPEGVSSSDTVDAESYRTPERRPL